MISDEDAAEFARLVECYNFARKSGDNDLYLRQVVNDLRIVIVKIQNSLGVVVASNDSMLGLT